MLSSYQIIHNSQEDNQSKDIYIYNDEHIQYNDNIKGKL